MVPAANSSECGYQSFRLFFAHRHEECAPPGDHGVKISESTPSDRSGSNRVGTWLSLVEHSLGVRGVGSSNLPVPTIILPISVQSLAIAKLTTADPRSTPR